MFTGIIEFVASIKEKKAFQITVERPPSFKDIRIGSSISVSGVCLTIVKLTKTAMTFDLTPETLKCTTLGSLKKSDWVNLERAMKKGDRFDGHMVQGHSEGTAIVSHFAFRVSRLKNKTRNPKPDTKNVMLTIALPKKLTCFVLEKGSIALDGVSLTVAEVKGNQITVALIPYTLKHTTLGLLKKGDYVNIETDIIVRYGH